MQERRFQRRIRLKGIIPEGRTSRVSFDFIPYAPVAVRYQKGGLREHDHLDDLNYIPKGLKFGGLHEVNVQLDRNACRSDR